MGGCSSRTVRQKVGVYEAAAGDPTVIIGTPVAAGEQGLEYGPSGTERVTAKTGPSTTVRFVNRTEHTVVLLWINAQGIGKVYKNIPAGDIHTQQTYVGHLWRIEIESTGRVGATSARRKRVPQRSTKHEHDLFEATHRHGGWYCNSCFSSHRGPGTKRWRCCKTDFATLRLCDFDLCESCMQASLVVKGPYTGNPEDYRRMFTQKLDRFEGWTFSGKKRAVRMMKGKSKENGFKAVTWGLVNDPQDCCGTHFYSEEQREEIVEFLLKDGEYKRVCEKHLGHHADTPPEYTGSPNYYIHGGIVGFAGFTGLIAEWKDWDHKLMGHKDGILWLAKVMAEEGLEAGLQVVTNRLVNTQWATFSLSREHKDEIVNALLESPDYKKACDTHLGHLARPAKEVGKEAGGGKIEDSNNNIAGVAS